MSSAEWDFETMNGVANDADPAEPPRAHPRTPAEIVRTMSEAGPLVRVPTWFRTLDEACRGGLPIPWRVAIVGAPSAGKTALASVLASRLEQAGLCIGFHAIDEDPEDQTARILQMEGFTIAECEQRDPETLAAMAAKVAPLRVRFYDWRDTIEVVADDVGAWAKAEGRKAALFVDTTQTVTSNRGRQAKSPRELVEANAEALRDAVERHRFLLVNLCEANRDSYRRKDSVDTQNDIAAGAESRAIEFMAQTLLMLRTPEGHADVIHARVPKNRKGARAGFEFWLRLDRDRHALAECSDPDDEPGVAEQRAQEQRTTTKREVKRDAAAVLRVIVANPGIGSFSLRAELRKTGLKMGNVTLAAALRWLVSGGQVEDRVTARGKVDDHHYVATGKGES